MRDWAIVFGNHKERKNHKEHTNFEPRMNANAHECGQKLTENGEKLVKNERFIGDLGACLSIAKVGTPRRGVRGLSQGRP